jgi:methylase of polypeptide subunit release factors
MSKRHQEKLLEILNRLSDTEAESLLAFGDFLLQRSGAGGVADVPGGQSAAPSVAEVPKPLNIPRPDDETVVKAIKRLSATYPMLDRNKLLGDTSALISKHVVEGHDRVEVIDELEIVFRRHYEALQNKKPG